MDVALNHTPAIETTARPFVNGVVENISENGRFALMTHSERAALRRSAAKMIERGATLSDVAQRFERSIKWVEVACAEHQVAVPKVDMPTSRSFQARAAAMVADGQTIDVVADHFDRSVLWVQRACVSHGISLPADLKSKRNHAGRSLNRVLRVLAALLNSNRTYAAIGEEHGVSKQRVEQISRSATEAGINLPPRKRGVRPSH